MKYTKYELLPFVQEQLALEYNCKAEDFRRNETDNVLVLPCSHPQRRKFSELDTPHFFRMATMGGNAVISADRPLHTWLWDFLSQKPGHCLFEYPYLASLQKQLTRYDETLGSTHHMFLPNKDTAIPNLNIPVKWFESSEIAPFYLNGTFPNALCSTFLPHRPDVLAVCAYDGDTIIGMAGCSADTSLLWQIGIDVFPQYRGRGIGCYLVSLIKKEIMKRGKIPYYGTDVTNLYSQNIAINCGFSPAWVEIETVLPRR